MAQRFDLRTCRPALAPVPLLVLLAASAAPALAQVPVEAAGGTRALGMGGAFTAVADDASATWWNPAGLPTLLADAVLEGGAERLVDDPDLPVGGKGAWRARPFAVAVAFPMVGLSFNHLTIRELRESPTGTAGPGRQDPAARVRAVDLSAIGVTLVQSLGDTFVAGTTVRLLSGGIGAATATAGTSVGSALDAAGRLETDRRTVLDADAGLMAFAGPVRLALVGRNLGGHRFEIGPDGQDGFRLGRSVRVGAAVGPGHAWTKRPWTLAVDADLTTTAAADGDRRSLAFGGERWIGRAQRFGIRAGGRVQTVGASRPVASGGASVALRRGVYVEAQGSGGGDQAANGWGLAARVTF